MYCKFHTMGYRSVIGAYSNIVYMPLRRNTNVCIFTVPAVSRIFTLYRSKNSFISFGLDCTSIYACLTVFYVLYCVAMYVMFNSALFMLIAVSQYTLCDLYLYNSFETIHCRNQTNV